MKLYTYRREFELLGQPWRVEAPSTLTSFSSRLMFGERCLQELHCETSQGLQTLVHELELAELSGQPGALVVEVGFISFWSLGIRVYLNGELMHESHPGRDIHYGEKTFGPNAERLQMHQAQKENWARNKYTIYADIGLGLVFFAAGKLTGDLSTAALIGAAAGLALVLAQRYVKVDLLGGFAVFGTIMLLISAGFSLAFQSEFMVQIKSTVLGLFVVALMFADGLFRKGKFFGQRIQRYLPFPIVPQRIAAGMGAVGLLMAGLNYGIAVLFSEDTWLTYTTFVDTPLSIGLTYGVFLWARAGAPAGRTEAPSGPNSQ
jgi:intracellular septation protein A